MKGLDLAERYFEHYDRPMLEQAFATEQERIAADPDLRRLDILTAR